MESFVLAGSWFWVLRWYSKQTSVPNIYDRLYLHSSPPITKLPLTEIGYNEGKYPHQIYPFTYKYNALNEKLPITKQNLCIFFSLQAELSVPMFHFRVGLSFHVNGFFNGSSEVVSIPTNYAAVLHWCAVACAGLAFLYGWRCLDVP